MQNPTYQRLIAGLAETVPPSCWWIPNELAIANLGISTSTRKRDTRLLVGLGVISEKGKRKGYTRNEYAALSLFRTVQSMSDRDVAAADIKQLFEDFKNHDNSRTTAA